MKSTIIFIILMCVSYQLHASISASVTAPEGAAASVNPSHQSPIYSETRGQIYRDGEQDVQWSYRPTRGKPLSGKYAAAWIEFVRSKEDKEKNRCENTRYVPYVEPILLPKRFEQLRFLASWHDFQQKQKSTGQLSRMIEKPATELFTEWGQYKLQSKGALEKRLQQKLQSNDSDAQMYRNLVKDFATDQGKYPKVTVTQDGQITVQPYWSWTRQTMGGGGREYWTYYTRDGKKMGGIMANYDGFNFVGDAAGADWNQVSLSNEQEQFRFIAHREDRFHRDSEWEKTQPLRGSVLKHFSRIVHNWSQQARNSTNNQAPQTHPNNIAWLQQEIASNSLDGQVYKRLLVRFANTKDIFKWKQEQLAEVDAQTGQIHGLVITQEGNVSVKEASTPEVVAAEAKEDDNL